MHAGLDQSLLSIDPSPARPGRRVSAEPRDNKANSFTLPSEPRGSSWQDRRTADPSRIPSPTERSARDEASQRTADSRRADPPRRDDPSGRESRPEGPRRQDETRRRDDPPRREDPPGQSRAEAHRQSDATEKASSKSPEDSPAANGAEEHSDEEQSDEAPEVEQAETLAPETTPLETAPLPAGIAEITEATSEGAANAEVQLLPVTVAVPGSATADPAHGAGHATGLERAAEVVTAQGRELPRGLKQAIGKKDPGAPPEDPAQQATSETASEPVKVDLAAAKLGQSIEAKSEPVAQNATPGLPPAIGKPGTDMQPPATTPSPAVPQGPHQVPHPVPLGTVPIEIGLKSLAGINRFEIRLDPAELGRIDVRLDIGESGEVKAHLVVDRVETLALLQRDAKTLERAFEQAGLKPSEGGVDLSLRDPSGDGRHQDQGRGERDGGRAPSRDLASGPERQEPPSPAPKRMQWRGTGGVDLRI
jgi:flagellar hook-length control protein FliK